MSKINYYIPQNLLGTNNAKTIKGGKKEYTTYIMYLAPYNQNDFGKNLCSHASKGCASACLFFSGMARYNHVQRARINKANYFISDTKGFMKQLYYEILKAYELHLNVQGEKLLGKKGNVIRYKKFSIRLNGTSDIPFENIKILDDKNIFELFPSIQFYDYTKNHKRFDKKLPANYHLTFSRSETNDAKCDDLLRRGYSVAYVFGNELPSKYLGYEVVNGDETDLRFLDNKNVIVGLKYKNLTAKGKSENNSHKFDSGFVINVNEKILELC